MGALRGRFALACVLAACGSERPTVALPSDDPCRDLKDGLTCMGEVSLRCVAGETSARVACDSKGQTCVQDLGCQTCAPFTFSCEGAQRYRCTSDGQRRELVESCPAELQCSAAGCRDLCADARAERSYLGCEYWPVFTLNRWLAPTFHPALMIGNGNLVAAHVKVMQGGAADAPPIAMVEVAPRSSDTLPLSYADVLQRSTESVLARGGAYHLTSDVPVTVHQFNPLLFEAEGDCPGYEPLERTQDGICNSYTNDASLLFPGESLGPDPSTNAKDVRFFVLSRPTWIVNRGDPAKIRGESTAGFVTVVAGGTKPVNIRVISSAYTSASTQGEAIAALTPEAELTQTLKPGDVLQLQSLVPEACPSAGHEVALPDTKKVCDPGRNYDLTGTEVIADGPIEVIGGHDCSYVPFDRPACDHIEESLPPVSTWGTTAVLTKPQVAPDASTMLRVISGADGNQIRFEPLLPRVVSPITLNRGEWVEVLADQPVYVTGSKPLLVGQYLIGQGGAGSTLRYGDPSLSVAVPVDQYRSSYNFVTPSTYTANFVDVIVATGDSAALDGVAVQGFVPVGSSGFSVATVKITQPGAHEIRGGSGRGLGIVLYGVGAYTSYMLPGGLDLTTLTVVI